MNAIVKAKLEHKALYTIKFEDGDSAIFRLLPWGEFKLLRELIAGHPSLIDDINVDIFTKCVLEFSSTELYYDISEPDGLIDEFGHSIKHSFDMLYEYIAAGCIDTIANLIMHLSGASDVNALFEDINAIRTTSTVDIEEQITSLISVLFKYTKEDFNGMLWEDIVKLLVQSELIYMKQTPEMPLALEGDKKKQKSHNIDFKKENRNLHTE